MVCHGIVDEIEEKQGTPYLCRSVLTRNKEVRDVLTAYMPARETDPHDDARYGDSYACSVLQPCSTTALISPSVYDVLS